MMRGWSWFSMYSAFQPLPSSFFCHVVNACFIFFRSNGRGTKSVMKQSASMCEKAIISSSTLFSPSVT